MQTRCASLLLLISWLLTHNAEAKIWRVNKLSNYNSTTLWGDNFGGTITYPIFSELDDVLNSNLVSATAGDTVYLEGCIPGSSSTAYASAHITKKLIIIGSGFFLTENTNVSNDQLPSKIVSIEFKNGSSGSQLIGVWAVSNAGSGGTISANTNNILIKRCKIDWELSIGNNVADILLIGNYFDNIVQPTSSSIEFGNVAPFDLVLKNNIFKKPVLLTIGSTIVTVQSCNNNVFDCPAISGSPSIKFNAAECRNNIIRSPNILVEVNGTNTNFTHNTSAANSQLLGTDPTNVHASNITALFVTGGTSDGRYLLNSSSPDNIAGYDGTERGAFSGEAISNHYSLSGLPPVSVIYSITTSGVSNSSGLSVTIKAKTVQ